jgi:hypothetical protein
MFENIKGKLYKLAIWYIGRCNAKWNKPTKDIEHLEKLTYRGADDKAYLLYGADAEWQNFSRYDVLNNAIHRLAKYEEEHLL